MEIALEILKYVLMALFGAIALYFKSSAVLKQLADEFVAQAENEYKGVSKSGGYKFDWVVNKIYEVMPTVLKMFISKSAVETAVQRAWEMAEQYATAAADKFVQQAVEKIKVAKSKPTAKK